MCHMEDYYATQWDRIRYPKRVDNVAGQTVGPYVYLVDAHTNEGVLIWNVYSYLCKFIYCCCHTSIEFKKNNPICVTIK